MKADWSVPWHPGNKAHRKKNEGQNHRMGKHDLPFILTRSLLKELLNEP